VKPFVSCIMPTHNRRAFFQTALDLFMRQTYAERELIIVDDGDDLVSDLIVGPVADYVTYTSLKPRRTIGEKRNIACEMARGDLLCHFDDDDWQHPERIARQVNNLGHHDLTGLDTELYLRAADRTAWRYTFPQSSPKYAIGNSFLYTRECWQKRKFAHRDQGEDTHFLWHNYAGIQIRPTDETLVVGMLHPHNVSAKSLLPPYWQPYPLDLLKRVMRDDFPLFAR
jgi:glycosyltransferase involved in cell wall biosynthesis